MTTGPVQKLHQLWSHYTQLSLAGKGSSSIEEYRLLIKRIQSLKHILQCLPNIVDLDLNGEIEILLVRLEKTNQTLIQSEPGRGGGAFEWIDSLLVKALISGHWLLIDNVNFCSASVLDRLNALLEPGGVLSVNERGVIDGQIPTIKPHPNFRLFLAMDSKYGEISRAMRNRGVEIYIPGEVDGCTYSRLDILSMLEGIGIRSYSIKHWLISVHDSVKQELPYTEKPTITDLLRCGVVVKQQLDKGMPLIQSLQQAAHDVYLRSLKTNSSKKIAAEIIQNSCNGFNINLSTDDSQNDLVPLVWPGTSELNENITLFNTCQASGVLSHFINKYTTLQNLHHQSSTGEINTTIHSLTTAFRIFLSDTSHNSIKFNQTWLEVLVRHLNLPEDNIQGEYGFSVSRFISLLPVLYSKCCQLMFNGTVNRKYLHLIEKLGTKQGINILLEEPWDIENNKQILDKIRLQHLEIDSFNTEIVIMDKVLHRFYMLMDVGIILSKCTKWLTFLEDQSVKARRTVISRSFSFFFQLHAPHWIINMLEKDRLEIFVSLCAHANW
ncbi:hypothetical protein LOTGIDRAFT_156579 [Lottia gigantea]|uniref:ATPase dynein-related AAA domain-containing protein n=1 Tax=Lottia gigantea TaxID=225164 RepID=V4BDX9_LOTGI|nr:hypothetical protein LOTGIDRAFT_156579 [Lottia gigantea]ESP03977.1 hypothetical protein LOTGIDRAFT_156579 [Lottia gigantea]